MCLIGIAVPVVMPVVSSLSSSFFFSSTLPRPAFGRLSSSSSLSSYTAAVSVAVSAASAPSLSATRFIFLDRLRRSAKARRREDDDKPSNREDEGVSQPVQECVNKPGERMERTERNLAAASYEREEDDGKRRELKRGEENERASERDERPRAD